MTNECRCGKPTRDAAYVCDDCLDSLGRALGDVTWLAGEMPTTIARQKGADYTGSTSRGAETPSPVHWGASEAWGHLKALLVSWALFCDAEGVRSADTRPGMPQDTHIALARWLLWRVDGLGLHDIGAEAVDEITSAVAHCHRLVDRPPEKRYAGPCTCGRDLYHRPGATEVTCGLCGEEHNVAAVYEAMRAKVMGRLVTAREGATLLSRFDLETKQGTIDKWRERKIVVERGHNQDGHRLYLFDDLLKLAARHAEKASA